MYKSLLVILMCSAFIGCFSTKGLPIKEVKENPQPQVQEIETIKNETIKTPSNNTQTIEVTVADTRKEKQTYTPKVDHAAWNTLLKKYVFDNGDVDYKGFKKDGKALNDYITYLSTQVPTEEWSLNEQLAYFINVYNSSTIKLIVENYPTKSIKDISNPWLKNRITIGDQKHSLAGIENGILRKMNEPRIHFAINCASVSCPKLLNTAYTATNVQELMDTATREFINNPKNNKLTRDAVTLSEIFKWYKSDFTEGMTIIEYINQYSDVKIFPTPKIEYLDYNWNLNEQN